MSFGKPPLTDNRVQQMRTHQGTMGQMASKSSRGGGGGARQDAGKRHFSNTYRPSEQYADTIRLIPEECTVFRLDDNNQPYQMVTPWMEFNEHYHAGVKDSCVCSGGVYAFSKEFANLRADCWGCYERYKNFDEYKAQNKQPPVSHSRQYAFNVLITGLFHQGTFRNDKGNTFQSWVKCPTHGCQFCGTTAPTKYGHVQAWPMFRSSFDQLQTLARHIETSCRSCGSRGSIQHVNWYCPQCNSIIFDQNTTATPEQLAESTEKPVVCPHCQNVGFLAESIYCTCGNPVRASIFDVDITLQLSNKNITCLGWGDPRPIDQAYAEAMKYKPNLSKKFAPTDLAEQAKRFRIQTQPVQAQGPVLANPGGAMPVQQPQAGSYVQEYQQPRPEVQVQQQQTLPFNSGPSGTPNPNQQQ